MTETKTVDDRELLSLLRNPATAENGFSILVNAYKVRLYYLIRQIVGNHEDADDVLQNVFIKVYRNIQNFQCKSTLFSWMYRIATNESLNFLQSNKTRQTIGLDDASYNLTNNSTDEFLDEKAIQEKLRKAVDTLPEKQKMVFYMRFYEELSYEEMSKILETSVGALKASYHHAVKKIELFIKETI